MLTLPSKSKAQVANYYEALETQYEKTNIKKTS